MQWMPIPAAICPDRSSGGALEWQKKQPPVLRLGGIALQKLQMIDVI
jgi:hypothetical protein